MKDLAPSRPTSKPFKFHFLFLQSRRPRHRTQPSHNPQTLPSTPQHLKAVKIMLMLLGAHIYAALAIGTFALFITEAFSLAEPKSTAVRRGFVWRVVTTIRILLASLAWPLTFIFIAGLALFLHFLPTPPATPTPTPTPRGEEHNLEAGLSPAPPALQAPAEIASAAPPAAPTPRIEEHNLEAGLNPAPPALQDPEEIMSDVPPAYTLIGPEGLAPLYDD